VSAQQRPGAGTRHRRSCFARVATNVDAQPLGGIVTKAKLIMNVVIIIAVLLALIGIALVSAKFYKILKDFTGVFLAIAGTYLAYCFQKRQAFLTSLRELWHKCIEAKVDLIDYTYNPTPNQESFGKAHRSISIAIDMVRAVYRNVRENKRSIGHFPFEPLHDMRKALERLGFTDISPDQQRHEREKIIKAWNALRWSMLREFSAPIPSHYITRRNDCDPRRRGEW
jgi:hypothetical protein